MRHTISQCFERIVDVGGGHGTLARLIGAPAPVAAVTAFDLSHLIDKAAGESIQQPCAGAVEFKSGNFLDSVPAPADVCVLKHILHDWDDENAHRILTNCRTAMHDGGRVLICEMVVGSGPEGMAALILDIEMLVGPGGRERTQVEFSDLLAGSGFRLERVIGTQAAIQILEAVPAN